MSPAGKPSERPVPSCKSPVSTRRRSTSFSTAICCICVTKDAKSPKSPLSIFQFSYGLCTKVMQRTCSWALAQKVSGVQGANHECPSYGWRSRRPRREAVSEQESDQSGTLSFHESEHDHPQDKPTKAQAEKLARRSLSRSSASWSEGACNRSDALRALIYTTQL